MDAIKFNTLRQKLLQSTDFTEIVEYFFEELGNDPAFAVSGEPYHDKVFLTGLAQAAARALGGKGGVFQGTPRRIAEHGLVHSAFMFGAWTGIMFFFEDVSQGFMALGDDKGPSRFVRFSLIASPNGNTITLH